MDNLSHSVAGFAAGELIHRILPEETDAGRHSLRRRLFLVSCWLASNFPDLDLILTPLLPEPLGYLLHHRGHTHTLLYALPQALLLAGLLWLLWPSARRLLRDSPPARCGFLIALASGFVLHLAMDYLNSYGIHPFHPFDSRWYYGDAVFILEPIFWIALGVTMAMTVPLLSLRILLIALLLGAPLFFTIRAYLPWESWFTLVAIAMLTGVLQHRSGQRKIAGLLSAIGVCAIFIGTQAVASQEAKRLIARTLQNIDPASSVLDISLTSFPSNPVCWIFASVESNEARDSYRLRRGVLSLAPQVLPVAHCPSALNEMRDKSDDLTIAWQGELDGSLSMLRELKRENCFFDAWLRFARMPFVSNGNATDIRFASSPRGNFTSLSFSDFNGFACPRHMPAWHPPRSDLFMGRTDEGLAPGSQ